MKLELIIPCIMFKIQEVFSVFPFLCIAHFCSHFDAVILLRGHSVCHVFCLSICSCPSTSPSSCLCVSLSLCSLTGLCVVRLSRHYMRHLFARCYCLHGGDFIRCCDNFINFGEIRLSFPEKEKMERHRGFGI